MDDKVLEMNQKKIAKEVLQDLLTMYFCFHTQAKVKNPFVQELYGYIMVFFYSVFLHELYQSKLIDENIATDRTKKIMNDFRQRFLKKQPILGKAHIDAIRKEMGIDFDYFVYDIILTVDKKDAKKLYSINFSVWDLVQIEKDKLELFNSVAGVPEKIIKGLFESLKEKEIAETIMMKFDELSELKAKELDKNIQPIKYPYASAAFFKNPEPCEQDKYLILYYYSYLVLISMVDEFVPSIKFEIGTINLDISYSLMKLKAMFIGAFGDTIRDLDTEVVRAIKKEIAIDFGESNVFKLNRKLRNNIHYTTVDLLTESEIEQIDIFQRKYMEIVLVAFNKRIKLKFGKWYRFIKWIADHTDSRILEEKKKQKELESDREMYK